MSLPIVIIFERHWDIIPKLIVKNLLPSLAEQGYDTYCFEAPQNLTSSEILARHNDAIELDSGILFDAEKYLKQVNIVAKLSDLSFGELAKLMRLYVSSQRYVAVAEKIKQLPASLLLRDIFVDAKRHSVDIQGIDIDDKDHSEIFSLDLSKMVKNIDQNEEHRIRTFCDNLLKLRQEKEGVIFSCGVIHARNLISSLQKSGLQDGILYYFPHAQKRYDDSIDDVKDVIMSEAGEVLKDHIFPLSKEDVEYFKKRVVSEIAPKTKYKKEIVEGTSHSEFLSRVFGVAFRVFMRPGYWVDALLNIDPVADFERITKKLNEKHIRTRYIFFQEHRYLVIPNVNAKKVAESIRTLR